jgi:hypothetical protein
LNVGRSIPGAKAEADQRNNKMAHKLPMVALEASTLVDKTTEEPQQGTRKNSRELGHRRNDEAPMYL